MSAQNIYALSDNDAWNGNAGCALLSDSYDWLQSSNPASIGVQRIPDVGVTRLMAQRLGGDNRLAQQSGSISSLGFQSGSYRSLERINLYGDFHFTQEWHRNRRWVDNFDSFNDNPYQVGGDIPGSYSRQRFDFSVMIASHPLWNRVVFGAAADYMVGDFSRNNDARSRAQKADYNLRLGAGIKLSSRSTIGVNGLYRRDKEKMMKLVAKAENSDKYTYYLYKGMGEYSTTGITFFNRRTMGDYYGGAVQYGYSSGSFSLVAEGQYTARADEIIGEQNSSPGDYSSDRLHANVKGSLRGQGGLHSINLTCDHVSGCANSFLQKSITVTNDKGMIDSYWQTLLSAVAYKNTRTDAGIQWRYYALSGEDYRWFVGADAAVEQLSNRYILPHSSLSYTSALACAEAGAVIVDRSKWSLDFTANGGYLFNVASALDENAELAADKLTVVNTNILEPNMDIIGSNLMILGCSLRCRFGITSATDGFVSLRTQHHLLRNGRDRYLVEFTAGIVLRGKR